MARGTRISVKVFGGSFVKVARLASTGQVVEIWSRLPRSPDWRRRGTRLRASLSLSCGQSAGRGEPLNRRGRRELTTCCLRRRGLEMVSAVCAWRLLRNRRTKRANEEKGKERKGKESFSGGDGSEKFWRIESCFAGS